MLSARQTLSITYSAHFKLARIALAEQPGLLTILQLNGPRHESQLRWIEQTEAFYTHSLARPDILELLATCGVTQAHIQDGMAKVIALRQAITKHQDQLGIAKESTSACTQARKQLQKWFTPFTQVARVALEEKPQLLSSLGISTPA
ncbi:hypothetical protein F8S13_22965 [Chloroflexia bacterium SDU3-3]|nr:hypothetical protein F8S13_22965 [Chloroflexia bacterium SDU3-3]